ncbi:MAG: hypothetical protein GX634_04895 [Lentisphaerae bacterium]|jgi:hypothetical protein|nr:hypothetical protein [Lentisphaerota bacterium]
MAADARQMSRPAAEPARTGFFHTVEKIAVFFHTMEENFGDFPHNGKNVSTVWKKPLFFSMAWKTGGRGPWTR